MDPYDGRVVSNFIVQALKSKPLTVYGDGSQTRSFCYVDDLIDGLVRLFFTDNVHEPINLGNPHPISMKSLAEKVINITKSSSSIVYEPMPIDDPKLREPDVTKAKELLNWEPKIDQELGIKLTSDYFKSTLSST
jgi:dTDP-glucose 4,6-dehydratase